MANDEAKFQPKQYWESRLKANWGLHGVGYLGLSDFNNFVYRVKGKVFLRVVRSLRLPAGFTALDVGCGTGFFIDKWLRLGASNLTGMDLTEVAVANLRQAFPQVNFVCADVSDRDVSLPSRFTAISAMDVLFHIVDDTRYLDALRHIHSMLDDNGYFIFSEFFLHGEPAVGRHHVSRKLTHIVSMLEEAGFSVVKRVPMHVLMNQPLDTRGVKWLGVWDRFIGFIERFNWAGRLSGALLCPIDSLLVRVLRESPSSELMVCRKIRGA